MKKKTESAKGNRTQCGFDRWRMVQMNGHQLVQKKKKSNYIVRPTSSRRRETSLSSVALDRSTISLLRKLTILWYGYCFFAKFHSSFAGRRFVHFIIFMYAYSFLLGKSVCVSRGPNSLFSSFCVLCGQHQRKR